MTKKDTLEEYNLAIEDFDAWVNIYNLNQLRQKAWLDQYKHKNIYINWTVKNYLEKYKHAYAMFDKWIREILENWGDREVILKFMSANKPKIYIMKFYKYQFYYVCYNQEKTIYIRDADDNNYIPKAKSK